MDESSEMLEWVKLLSSSDRLRMIGVLAQHPSTLQQMTRELNLPLKQVFNAMAYFEYLGIAHRTGELYELDARSLEELSRRQFTGERDSYVPAPDLDDRTRKILTVYLNPDGTLKTIPLQPAKLRVILNYLINAFTPGQDYSEREVNAILLHFHVDTAALRRYLVDAGLLARESNGSRYWRPEQNETAGSAA